MLLTLTYLFFLGISHAQEFQGKAYYQSKTTVDMDFGGREMSEEQKKRIKERMKSAFEKTYVLTFDKTAGIYLEEEKLETPGGGGPGGFRFGGIGGGGKLYKNIKDQSYVNQSEMFGKVFLIKDNLEKLEWKMGTETKKIGNYTCYKATAIKPKDSTDFASLMERRRKERDREQAATDSTSAKAAPPIFTASSFTDETEVVAWFTPEIPVSQGPGEYWGLPGLILEVNYGKTAILCSKIVLNADEKERIEAPNKGKEVSQEAYNQIMLEKVEEMSERFRGGNRGREGNQIRIQN